jgi:hypothetical protein
LNLNYEIVFVLMYDIMFELELEIVFILMYDIMFELELEVKLSKLYRCAAPLLMARQAWVSAPCLGADCLCGSALQACGTTAGGVAGMRRHGGWRGRRATPAAVVRQRSVRRLARLIWLLDSGGILAAGQRRRLAWRGSAAAPPAVVRQCCGAVGSGAARMCATPGAASLGTKAKTTFSRNSQATTNT